MLRKSRIVLAVAAMLLAGILGGAVPVRAQNAKAGVEAGILKCNVAGGFGFIFGSSKDLECVYSPGDDQGLQRYSGKIQKFGVDIGYTRSGVLIWVVIAPGPDLDWGALEGEYVGATAELTAGLGLGANALVGGDKSIALQPLSIGGREGLNIAGGIGAVTLEWVQ